MVGVLRANSLIENVHCRLVLGVIDCRVKLSGGTVIH